MPNHAIKEQKLVRKQQFLSIVAELLKAQDKVFGTEPAFESMHLSSQEIKTWLRFGAETVGCRWVAGREDRSGPVRGYTPGHIVKVLT